jgi:hypothetical protein
MGGRKAGMWRHTDITCVARDWSRWLDKGPTAVGVAWFKLGQSAVTAGRLARSV